MTTRFDGFSHGQFTRLPLPPGFFSDWLPLIDDLDELKLMLYCLHTLGQQPPHVIPHLRHRQVLADPQLLTSLSSERIEAALARCVARGTLLMAEVTWEGAPEQVYFVNTPRGRNALQQAQLGRWQPPTEADNAETLPQRPNAYTLYEQHIGVLTARVAEELKDAEAEFTASWLEDAIKLAAQNGKPHWQYVRGILTRWKKQGRPHENPARHHLEDGKRYISGKYADFIES